MAKVERGFSGAVFPLRAPVLARSGTGSSAEGPLGLSLASLSFLYFFAAVFAVYWLARSNALQKWVLLVAAADGQPLLFSGSCEP